MRVGDKIKITKGKYSEIYYVAKYFQFNNTLVLRRIILPKSKADAGRHPENIELQNLSPKFK